MREKKRLKDKTYISYVATVNNKQSWPSISTHYGKSPIFVQKVDFDKTYFDICQIQLTLISDFGGFSCQTSRFWLINAPIDFWTEYGLWNSVAIH